MERSELQEAARALGMAMSRMARRGIFPDAAGPQVDLDLFSLAQALGGPAEDGRHLAQVVRALSAALEAALQRKAQSS